MKKKSAVRSATAFLSTSQDIRSFINEVTAAPLSKKSTTHVYDAAIIKLYVAFERLMFDCLAGALNRDSTAFSAKTGVTFPVHMNLKVCEYLVTGGGYFDFKGRSALISTMKDFTPEGHYLVKVVAKDEYHFALELLLALRHLAAHESPQSRKRARLAIYQFSTNKKDASHKDVLKANARVPPTAGSWLKRPGRFNFIAADLDKLANEIITNAPF